MKTIKSLFVLVAIFLATTSCDRNVEERIQIPLDKYTCEMRLVGSLIEYESETRSETPETPETKWEDGSIIYLRMESPMGVTLGEATYNAEKDVWAVSYYGSLYEGVETSCIAFYVEDKVAYDNYVYTFDSNTAIYEDLDGSYIFEDGTLVVTANLKPRTGRMRFKGDAGSVLKLYGITHHVTLNIDTNTYTTIDKPIKVTIGDDGYTPYIYGYFTNEEVPSIKVWIDAKEAYTRFCSKDIFKAGQSGMFSVPTEESHNGWADGLIFNINGVQFKMIAVEGGTFTMGDPNSTSEYYTAHKVTLTGFCVGETEVTDEQYNFNKTTTLSNPNNPHEFYYSSQSVTSYIVTYIANINDYEKINFNMLTEAQWEFAARGGVKSKGFIYSGSDVYNDVAPDKTQNVKSKLPNELGIYGMSGGYDELVLDFYAPYPNVIQVNPCVVYSGTGTNNICFRSGYPIYKRNYTSYSTTYVDIACRLALNWND